MLLGDAWIKLFDKFVELTRERERRRDKLYEKIVAPIFEGMQAIHDDYLQILHTTHKTLENTKSAVEGYKHFETRRLELQGSRHELLTRANDLLGFLHLTDCHDFLSAVQNYLRGGVQAPVMLSGSDKLIRDWTRETLDAASESYFRQSQYQRALRRKEDSAAALSLEPPKRLEIDMTKIEEVLKSAPVLSRLQRRIDEEIGDYQRRWLDVASEHAKWLAKTVSF